MQVETRRIYVYHPDGGILRAIYADQDIAQTQPNAPAKRLLPGKGGSFEKPTFMRDIKAEDLGEQEFYGNPYNFNTKYVVDAEADDTIGCHITLASGKRVWVDMTAESVNHACNRR